MKMIILPILTLLLISLLSSCTRSSTPFVESPKRDNTVMLHWLDLDEEGIVKLTNNDGNLSGSSKAFSGKAIETFEQSPTKSISQWRDGKKHGTTTEYFYNGRKRRVVNYSYGIQDGVAEEYRITGELLRRETYREGILNGAKSEWHPNGAKILEVQMRDGQPHGEALEWYPNGLEKSSTIYRHGLREGPSSEWYPNGQRKLGLFYQKDKQHGQKTIWYEDGQKRLTAIFDEDMMEGNSKGWFPNGQQQFDYNFRRNLEHGVCTEWDTNGKKISEILFDDGTPSQNLLTGKKVKVPVAETKDESIDQSVESPSPSQPLQNKSLENNLPLTSSKSESPPTEEKVQQIAVPVVESSALSTQEDFSKTPKSQITSPEIDPPVPSPPSQSEIPAESSFNPFKDEPLEPATKPVEKVEEDTFTPKPPPPPPPPTTTPFDPFAEDSNPQPPQAESVQNDFVPPPPPPPPPPPTFNPFEDEPSSTQPVNEISLPPPPPPPPNPVIETPFDSQTAPIPSIAEPPSSFDPFAEQDKEPEPKVQENENGVPLGDVFNEPLPSTDSESEEFDNLPPPPPPPPTFNPFDSPPLPNP